MYLKLAILDVLADHQGRGLKLNDIRRSLRIKIRSQTQLEQSRKFAGLGDVDIVRLGLASRDDAGWQITGAGLSFLEKLKNPGSSLPAPSPASATAILTLVDDLAHIDELVEMETRLKKFNTEIKFLDEILNEDAQRDRDQDRYRSAQESDAAPFGNLKVVSTPVDLDATTVPHSRAGENEDKEPSAGDGDRTATDVDDSPPAFLQKAAGAKRANRKTRKTLTLAAVAAAKNTFLLQGLRLNPARTNAAAGTASERKMLGGAAIILFALLGIAATVAGAIALSQMRSFHSENTVLQREISKLKEQVVKVEQSVKAKGDLRPAETQVQPAVENRADQTALNLSRDEVLLIRDYIKPVRPTSTAQPAINVGDPINAATIPLPSPLVDKIPKLIGARFTIQNGAIVILKKDSRRADVVLN